MSPTALTNRLRRPVTAGAALTAVLLLSLTACGGSSTATDTPSAPAAQEGGRAGGQGRQPGISGLIAAIDGKTLQVQGTDAQTAVTYTAKTTFTEVGSASASDLKTGLCATVLAAGTPTAGAPAEAVTAASVTLTAAVDGSCRGGFGGGGARPSGRPSGAPTDQPSGAPSGGPGGMDLGASGKVLSVSGTTFVVESDRRTGEATKVTVTTTGDTTWSQVAKTTAKAVAVGKCATANGKTSDTGAMTATTLRLSKATNGTCTTGFGGRGRPGPSGTPTNG